MTRLPRSTERLRDLRAARWMRESARGQHHNLGPEAQARQQCDATRDPSKDGARRPRSGPTRLT